MGQGRHALEHDGRGAVEHRSVDDVAVAGDPADVGGAPIHVARLVLEDVGEAVAGVDHVAPARVDHALGLARAPGGVEDEQEVLRSHPLRRAVGGGGGQGVVQPDVAALGPVDGLAGVANDEVGGDRGAFGEGLVDDGLEAEPLGAALHAVAGDHAHRAGILDAVGEAAGGEAGKHHAVHRTNAGAGEHSHSELRHHGQVQRHPVALLHAARLEHIGEAAHAVQQLGVGDRDRRVRRIVGLPQDGGAVAVAGGHMAVEAVGGDVELGAVKPAHARRVEFPVAHGVPRGHPLVVAGDVGPEGLGVGGGIAAGPGHGFGRIQQERHGHKLTTAWIITESDAVPLAPRQIQLVDFQIISRAFRPVVAYQMQTHELISPPPTPSSAVCSWQRASSLPGPRTPNRPSSENEVSALPSTSTPDWLERRRPFPSGRTGSSLLLPTWANAGTAARDRQTSTMWTAAGSGKTRW